MGTKPREVIWGGRIMDAKIHAQGACECAQQAVARPTGPKPRQTSEEKLAQPY